MVSRRRFLAGAILVLALIGALVGTFFSRPIKAGLEPGPMLRLARATFDPLMDVPDWPAELSQKAARSGKAGLYLVQFAGPIREDWKATVRRHGARLFDYVPDYAFLAWMDAEAATRVAAEPSVRWVGFYQPAYRFSPQLDRASGRETVTVVTLPTVDMADFQAQLERLGGVVLDGAMNAFAGYFRVQVAVDQLPALAHLSPVIWVEPDMPPRFFNDQARGEGVMDAEAVWQELDLYGDGQIVGICDTGLDLGTGDDTLNDDFEGRLIALYDGAGDGAEDRCSGHGTHVAGSVLGSGVNSGSDPAQHDYAGSYAGLAPEAQLVFQAIERAWLPPFLCFASGFPTDLNTLFEQAYGDGARIHTNSWGTESTGAYDTDAQQTDQFAWTHKDMTILFAAGNSGTDADGDGVVDLDSMATPATAKNCITVGASENRRPVPSPNPDSGTYGAAWPRDFRTAPLLDDGQADDPNGIAAFSSRGPCDDGRIKPDLVAPGTWILSTYSQANHPADGGSQYDGDGDPPDRWYKYMGGSSMSAPLAAGAAVLVREYYNDVLGLETPSSALIKATLINGALDITPGQYGAGAVQEVTGRPDNVQGWGRLDLAQALLPDAPRRWWYDDHAAGLHTAEAVTYTHHVTTPLVVVDAGEPLRVSLVWTDYPGTPAAAGGLVNDLDLTVIGPDGTRYYGNGVDGERVNNVEGVDILTPTLGGYTLTVRAHNVPVAPQPYALVTSGVLTDVYCVVVTGTHLTTSQAVLGHPTIFSATVQPVGATRPVRYTWDLGDGTVTSGTFSITRHLYGQPGVYTATVAAANCGGAAMDTLPLVVSDTCQPLRSVRASVDGPVDLGEALHFQATITPTDATPPVVYTWAFGGAGTGTGLDGPRPVFTYTQVGTYTVSVTATNCPGTNAGVSDAVVEARVRPSVSGQDLFLPLVLKGR